MAVSVGIVRSSPSGGDLNDERPHRPKVTRPLLATVPGLCAGLVWSYFPGGPFSEGLAGIVCRPIAAVDPSTEI
jgi:hypothetical protein